MPVVATVAALATAGVGQSYARPGVAAGGEQPGGGCRVEDLGTVSARASSPVPVPAGWRSAGGGPVTRTGRLGHDCVSPNWNGELARYYRFELTRAAEVEVTITSSEIGTWVGLREGAALGGSLMAQASAWAGDVARVTARLSAGAYTVEASSPEEGVATAGPFTLTVAAGVANEAVASSRARSGSTRRGTSVPERGQNAGADSGPSIEDTREWLERNVRAYVSGSDDLERYSFAYVLTSGNPLGRRERRYLRLGDDLDGCEHWAVDQSQRFSRFETSVAASDTAVYHTHLVRLDYSLLSRAYPTTALWPIHSTGRSRDAVRLEFGGSIGEFRINYVEEKSYSYSTGERSNGSPITTHDPRVTHDSSEVSAVVVLPSSEVSAERVMNALTQMARACGNVRFTVGDLFD